MIVSSFTGKPISKEYNQMTIIKAKKIFSNLDNLNIQSLTIDKSNLDQLEISDEMEQGLLASELTTLAIIQTKLSDKTLTKLLSCLLKRNKPLYQLELTNGLHGEMLDILIEMLSKRLIREVLFINILNSTPDQDRRLADFLLQDSLEEVLVDHWRPSFEIVYRITEMVYQSKILTKCNGILLYEIKSGTTSTCYNSSGKHGRVETYLLCYLIDKYPVTNLDLFFDLEKEHAALLRETLPRSMIEKVIFMDDYEMPLHLTDDVWKILDLAFQSQQLRYLDLHKINLIQKISLQNYAINTLHVRTITEETCSELAKNKSLTELEIRHYPCTGFIEAIVSSHVTTLRLQLIETPLYNFLLYPHFMNELCGMLSVPNKLTSLSINKILSLDELFQLRDAMILNTTLTTLVLVIKTDLERDVEVEYVSALLDIIILNDTLITLLISSNSFFDETVDYFNDEISQRPFNKQSEQSNEYKEYKERYNNNLVTMKRREQNINFARRKDFVAVMNLVNNPKPDLDSDFESAHVRNLFNGPLDLTKYVGGFLGKRSKRMKQMKYSPKKNKYSPKKNKYSLKKTSPKKTKYRPKNK